MCVYTHIRALRFQKDRADNIVMVERNFLALQASCVSWCFQEGCRQNISRMNMFFIVGRRYIAKFKIAPEIINQMLSLNCQVLHVLRLYLRTLEAGFQVLETFIEIK